MIILTYTPIKILYGVPQGLVLEPLLFYIYLRPLSNIISKFPNITYHIYAYNSKQLTDNY